MFISTKHIQKCLTGGLVLLIFLAQLVIWVPSYAAITPIDFAGFNGSGFAASPAAGQLDSDIWRVTGLSDGTMNFGDSKTSGDFARGSSSGDVTTGGIYAFDVGNSNVILGIQPIGDDFTPGEITLKVENTTGHAVTEVYISYKIWVNNDQDRANSLNFSYSTDDSSYTSVAALDFTTPEAADASPAWTSTNRSTTITGINLANGASLYLKWTGDDVSGSNYRDEYGIDDIEARIGGPTAITLFSLNARSERPSIWPEHTLYVVPRLQVAVPMGIAVLSTALATLWMFRNGSGA